MKGLTRLSALSLIAMSCATPLPSIPSDTAPRMPSATLDQAAITCLDWAWSIKATRELGGGVLVEKGVSGEDDTLTCSPLTLGTRNGVTFFLEYGWLATFHTHTGRGPMSYQDHKSVRNNPLGIPGYMRDPRGGVWTYGCEIEDEGKKVWQSCRERKVR